MIELEIGTHQAALVINPFTLFRRYLLITQVLNAGEAKHTQYRDFKFRCIISYSSLTKMPLLCISEHIVLLKVKDLT